MLAGGSVGHHVTERRGGVPLTSALPGLRRVCCRTPSGAPRPIPVARGAGRGRSDGPSRLRRSRPGRTPGATEGRHVPGVDTAPDGGAPSSRPRAATRWTAVGSRLSLAKGSFPHLQNPSHVLGLCSWEGGGLSHREGTLALLDRQDESWIQRGLPKRRFPAKPRSSNEIEGKQRWPAVFGNRGFRRGPQKSSARWPRNPAT